MTTRELTEEERIERAEEIEAMKRDGFEPYVTIESDGQEWLTWRKSE